MSSILPTNFDTNSTAIPFVVAPVSPNRAGTPSTSFPTSEAQLEVWLHSQLSREANCAFNETATLNLRGRLDESAIRQALDGASMAHEMLRATFSENGSTVLVRDCPHYEFEKLEHQNLLSSEIEGRHRAAIENQGNRPFDLENGPLLRVTLVRIAQEEYRLTFTAHHLVLDGWSVFVFCREIGYRYNQILGLEPNAAPPADRYIDYAKAMVDYEASDVGLKDESFWLDQYRDSIPVLELPTDRPRPALKTFNSQRVDYRIVSANVALIRKAGAKSGCSLFNYILAGFHAYLARISGQSDFAIGIPTAGQSSLSFHNLIGHCVNTVPFRAKTDLTQSASKHAKEMRGKLLDTLEHQRYTFGRLVRKLAPPRNPSQPPIFSVMINIDPAIDEREFGFTGLETKLTVEPRVFENFEWFISGVCEKNGDLELQCQFNSDLFNRSTLENHLEGFEAFLLAMASSPELPLAQLPVLSLAQRKKIVVDRNQTHRDLSGESTVLGLILSQASRTPSRNAVQFSENTLAYHEVHSKVNQLARYLTAHGISRGDRVGILMPRSEWMLLSALGIWQAGAAYVPLDPSYPQQRLQMVCEDAGLKHIITAGNVADKLPEFSSLMMSLDSILKNLDSFDSGPLSDVNDPKDTAYMIYTSGSTGTPKGVQVPHGSVVNFLCSMKEEPGICENDCVLAITTMAFDISVLELFLPLAVGAQVVIADQESVIDGSKLIALMNRHDVSLLQATPSTWRMLIDAGWNGEDATSQKRLKALCGGEAFPRDLIAPMLERCSEVWNMYGPTETTVWSSLFRVQSNDFPVPIGRPIANTQLYILDANRKEVAIGTVGELYIGGAGVTLGYWNRDELTADRFVENPFFNPFIDYINHRLYRTGDLARFRADGNIEFLQRNDKQVKVRGHRIELGEIEHRMLLHPNVRQSVVMVREDQPGDVRIVAYYVCENGKLLTHSDLRMHLRETLPAYMLPQHFVEIPKLPTTENGKLDTKQLPAVTSAAIPAVTIAPRTSEEILVASVWKELLGVSSISITDNFFSLGGHSLLVMQSILRIKERAQVQLSPQDFLLGTLEQLAHRISEKRNTNSIDNPVNKVTKLKEKVEEEAELAAVDSSNSSIDESDDRYLEAVKSIRPPVTHSGIWKRVSDWLKP